MESSRKTNFISSDQYYYYNYGWITVIIYTEEKQGRSSSCSVFGFIFRSLKRV